MDLWAQVALPVATAAVGWFGNAWKYRSERAQKEAELDQKDDELAQTKQRDADERLRAQEERELELIDKARDLLNNGNEGDKQAARFYLMGLIRVQANRTQLVEEILDNFSKKEFGLPVAQIRAADRQNDEYLVLVGDAAATTDEVVAELTTEEDDGTNGTGAADNGDQARGGAMVKRIRVIKVTESQVRTAQDQIERDRLMNRPSDPAVVKIANAKGSAEVRVPLQLRRSNEPVVQRKSRIIDGLTPDL